MKLSAFTLTPLLPLLASAAPYCQAHGASGASSTATPSTHPTVTPSPSPGPGTGTGNVITPAQIKIIAPMSVSCANVTDFPAECATAEDAAPALTKAFQNYGVTSKAEQAAVLGLIAMESGEFRYNRNHYPGRPGQGTRNMQMATFNQEYALSFPSLVSRVEEAGDDVDAVLDIILEDPVRDFGSGAWFLTTHCAEEYRTPLKTGSQEGWEGFITQCVGTEAEETRMGYWFAAKKALGI